MAEKLDEKKIGEIREALTRAGLGNVLVDRLVRGAFASCDESCYSGCSKCCSSGTANRAAEEVVRTS
jgi:hypothetical protein